MEQPLAFCCSSRTSGRKSSSADCECPGHLEMRKALTIFWDSMLSASTTASTISVSLLVARASWYWINPFRLVARLLDVGPRFDTGPANT